MAIISFSKWHGTGNDFILVDDRQRLMPVDAALLARQLCDRHFGIGSDGLILLRDAEQPGIDYHMEFFNPDGSRSFCGNGSRCAFAFRSLLVKNRSAARFSAIDGVHVARWVNEEVEITMRDVGELEEIGATIDLLNTGSPHLVVWVENPASVDILPEAHAHRYSARFAKDGVNVNFVRWHNGRVEMRTYERGVEAETLSCGTGVTAAALSAMARGHARRTCSVITPGGGLTVSADRSNKSFVKILLQGPVTEVFHGNVELSL